MARPATFGKRENEKKKQQKRAEKQKRKEEKKTSGKSGSLDDMIAYVDENGMITSTPPDLTKKKEKIKQEDIQISIPKREDEEIPIRKGRVEHFSPEKGFGFIKEIGRVDKYFFHISKAPQDIGVGDVVTFDLEKGTRGMNAVNIAFAEN